MELHEIEKFIEYIENGTLFKSENEVRWICLNCGEIVTAKEAPKVCEVCNHGIGYQMRQDWILI